MKSSFKTLFIRILILLLGLIIAHFGVTLFLLADLGSDPFNVFVQGLFRSVTRIPFLPFSTHGTVHIAVCFFIILVLFVADRSYIKIGTLLCMIFGGPIIDIFTKLLQTPFSKLTSLTQKLPILALGCVILAFGMTIVIKSDAGTGPNDLVAVIISDKSHRPFSVIRIIVDVSFIVIGFLLGGSIGIGTLICALLVGPVAGIFLPINEKWIKALIKE